MRSLSALPVLRRLAQPWLSAIRRGPRLVLWTDPGVQFGNILYSWLRAHSRQAAGLPTVVRWTPPMRRWEAMFPALAEQLIIRPDQVRMTDRRQLGYFQGWTEHTQADRLAFCEALLADSTVPVRPDGDPGRVVVTIRRGDYYSPRFAGRFSIDTEDYLRVALARQIDIGGLVSSLHVLSDDPQWCRDHPGWAQGVPMELASGGAEQHLAALAGARRLILTHTTFGYWGAQLSNALHKDNHHLVVVPWFHDRMVQGGEATAIDPAWSVVRDIPTRWAPEGQAPIDPVAEP